MISVPSDAEGRAWTAARPRDRKVEQNALVTLVTAEDDGTISVLGTAFVIYGHEDNAICLAAGHSFESVKQRQQTRAGRNFLSMPPDFRPTGPEYVKMEGEVFAFVAVNGEPIVCSIVSYNANENFDVAVIGLKAPEGRKIFDIKIPVDLSVPRVGDEVGALVNHITIKHLDDGGAELNFDSQLRRGVVTELNWDTSAGSFLKGQQFLIKTSIPMQGGMSGSPLLSFGEDGVSGKAIGVISSNWENPEAAKSFRVAGSSTASMIWPAMGLGVTGNYLDVDAKGFLLLGTLLAGGALENRTAGVQVVTTVDDRGVNVHYNDFRSGCLRYVELTFTNQIQPLI